jgi:KUP system potassium uptake protein
MRGASMSEAVQAGSEVASSQHGGHGHQGSMAKLAIGAVGVVFGDIGTSPIYAFRETFAGHHRINADSLHILGVLSLVFWSMLIVVTFKYVLTIMKADNKGEGGSLALLALINRKTEGASWTAPIVLLGVFATALFYGDSMITPAMSVLSATEGLSYVSPAFAPFIVPIALVILVGLFAIQSHGTEKVGKLFGPIMITYFLALAGMASAPLLPWAAWCWRSRVQRRSMQTWGISAASPLASAGWFSCCRACCSTTWARVRWC